MIQKICFICKEPVSSEIKMMTCNSPKCQYDYQVQHDTWKKNQMDYLYGITYQPEEEE